MSEEQSNILFWTIVLVIFGGFTIAVWIRKANTK